MSGGLSPGLSGSGAARLDDPEPAQDDRAAERDRRPQPLAENEHGREHAEDRDEQSERRRAGRPDQADALVEEDERGDGAEDGEVADPGPRLRRRGGEPPQPPPRNESGSSIAAPAPVASTSGTSARTGRRIGRAARWAQSQSSAQATKRTLAAVAGATCSAATLPAGHVPPKSTAIVDSASAALRNSRRPTRASLTG